MRFCLTAPSLSGWLVFLLATPGCVILCNSKCSILILPKKRRTEKKAFMLSSPLNWGRKSLPVPRARRRLRIFFQVEKPVCIQLSLSVCDMEHICWHEGKRETIVSALFDFSKPSVAQVLILPHPSCRVGFCFIVGRQDLNNKSI